MVSHYIVFLSSHHRGYQVMKEIMAKHSLCDGNGVPKYIWSRAAGGQLALPFKESLKTVMNVILPLVPVSPTKVSKVFDTCHKKGLPYLNTNIRDALQKLEEIGRILVDVPSGDRPIRNGQRTLGGDRKVCRVR